MKNDCRKGGVNDDDVRTGGPSRPNERALWNVIRDCSTRGDSFRQLRDMDVEEKVRDVCRCAGDNNTIKAECKSETTRASLACEEM